MPTDLDLEVSHMHRDMEELKKDIAVIKHVLTQEGELTEEAEKKLEEARDTADSEYIELE